ncbi:MAG: HAMP domain-containing protein, partial [Pyrinomonadaceae bacterium]|nr:HAMP domain-containing protein [Pyrinomonadaceae bacterium]
MSLFLKIFLWFWLAMALVAMAIAVSTATMQTEPLVASWRVVAADALAIYATSAAEAFEREGQAGLAAYLERMERQARVRAVVFDEQGREISGRVAPERARELAQRAGQSGEPEFEFVGAHTLGAQRAWGAGGARYVLVAEVERSRFAPLRAEPRTRLLRILAVFLTAGVVCYWLARYLSSPIVKLRVAARQLASGDLTARVHPAMKGRRDELADLAKDFDEMAARIESLMLAQRRLTSDISHELRSPLARLNVALELARQRAGIEAQDALERIEREAVRLNALISQLLTLSRLESGAEIAGRESVDLPRLVREAAADADYEARSRNRTVRVGACDEITLHGIEEMLRSAIENVLRNAVRYTKENTAVEISLSRVREADKEHAVINVRDHGAGVPEAQLGELFRPFYRVADARERQTGGIGLGLAI